MANPPGPAAGQSGRETTPTDFPEINPRTGQAGHDFTLQAVMEMQRTLASLGTKVDRLLQDRSDDRAEYRDDVKSLRSDLQNLKDKDLDALRKDVEKLRLSWAKIAGGAVIVATLVGFLAEIIRARITG